MRAGCSGCALLLMRWWFTTFPQRDDEKRGTNACIHAKDIPSLLALSLSFRIVGHQRRSSWKFTTEGHHLTCLGAPGRSRALSTRACTDTPLASKEAIPLPVLHRL